MPAAPPPVETMRISSMRLPMQRSALSTVAPTTMAVPCWSSCSTGIFIRARSPLLDDEALGRLDVLQVDRAEGCSRHGDRIGQLLRVALADLDVEHVDVGELFEQDRLPSMTGFAASGPMLPRPSTAVPLEITATRLPRAVKREALAGSSAIAMHASATPGE